MSPLPAKRLVSVTRELTATVGELLDSLVTSVQGMFITARYLAHPSEIVTFRYPLAKLELLPNFRGRLVNDPERCISCELCARTCPTGCIAVESELGADKKRILKKYTIDLTKCLFCGLCTEACPDVTKNAAGQKCLTMSGGYEYSSARKESLGYCYQATEDGLAAKRAAAQERAQKTAAAAAAKAAKPAAPSPLPLSRDGRGGSTLLPDGEKGRDEGPQQGGGPR